jgi:hypothetical protein
MKLLLDFQALADPRHFLWTRFCLRVIILETKQGHLVSLGFNQLQKIVTTWKTHACYIDITPPSVSLCAMCRSLPDLLSRPGKDAA